MRVVARSVTPLGNPQNCLVLNTVPWLWIDSLCIIQDSEKDWRREASLMHQVYKHGFLYIAAEWAADAREGLFHSCDSGYKRPFTLRVPALEQALHLTINEGDMFDWMYEGPLSQRAWAFQERHLARRILHFTRYEIIWNAALRSRISLVRRLSTARHCR